MNLPDSCHFLYIGQSETGIFCCGHVFVCSKWNQEWLKMAVQTSYIQSFVTIGTLVSEKKIS